MHGDMVAGCGFVTVADNEFFINKAGGGGRGGHGVPFTNKKSKPRMSFIAAALSIRVHAPHNV
jgi:hypothetical protein